jgi:hypothetical protein
VRPEVAQVGAHGRGVAVDGLLGELEPVEGLVPELALGVRAQDPFAGPGTGGQTTIARTWSGAVRATVWAMRLPMS